MADTYIVAELGTSHGGDLNRAAESIAAAAAAGADCAKFQFVIADEIVHPATGLVDLPGGPVPLYERFKAVERDPAFYLELQALCDRHHVDFLCTPFGTDSLAALLEMGVRRIKIASPEINHTRLLSKVGESGVSVVLSTGVSKLADIEYALDLLSDVQVTLLHCVTAYPAPEAEYNLKVIPVLSRVFALPVGLSDHSRDPELVPGLAAALGVTIIEKHFTLDKSAGGLDDPIALDPDEFGKMCATVRRVDAVRTLDPKDGGNRVLDEFASEFGEDRVNSILGDGVKRLAKSEAPNYATTRRSIHVLTPVKPGESLTADRLAVLRSEKNLTPGIHPCYLDLVTGSQATTSIAEGEGLQWAHLISRT